MRHCGSLLALIGLTLTVTVPPTPAQAPPPNGDAVPWIWYPEGNPAQDAPVGDRCFRRTFDVIKTGDPATLDLTADNSFTAWLNGREVGRGGDWHQVYRFDVSKQLRRGRNVLAVRAHNDGGPAGLVVRLTYGPRDPKPLTLVSDSQWKTAQEAPAGWHKPEFDDTHWVVARVLGAAVPWRDLDWPGAAKVAKGRFTVVPGFKVEEAVVNPGDRGPFSLVNMCFDHQGRLFLSQEGGPILLATNPDEHGVYQGVAPYCTQVKNNQGMCWIKGSLYLVGDGPKGTGLYRCRDKAGKGAIDTVELLHQFRGGMGEHGPHAVLHGPDDCLYVVIGNHAWANVGPDAAKNGANPEKLAANSPLTRWPTGGMGPDQGKPNTTEDVLLPRLNDARGHAANILAPGGTIWRFTLDGKEPALVAAGFRNHFDAAFSPSGELFTFDSDMEWDEGLPWYRAVRVCHCPPGADFVWRTGAANTPPYYLDSLPPLYETGRGSPVGLEFYDHNTFPARYRGAYFMADWSLGIIYAVHLERAGATYKAKEVEKFCTGAPLNVTDLNVGPDGSLYFCMGGRGTQGGVYRIVPMEKAEAPKAGEDKVPQPLAPWNRLPKGSAEAPATANLIKVVQTPDVPRAQKLQALTLLHGRKDVTGKELFTLVQDPKIQEEVSDLLAHLVWLEGVQPSSGTAESLLRSLKSSEELVRRRACEALIRAGIEPPVEAIWPQLKDADRFVRHAARLVLERIDSKKWTDRLWAERDAHTLLEGIVALCQTNQAAPHAEHLFEALHDNVPRDDEQALLDWLRTIQLALVHTTQRPGSVRGIAVDCLELFPQTSWRANRELAILLTEFRREKILDEPVHARLLAALQASKADRMQQIHYFYCLRLVHEGWTPEQKTALLTWFEGTRDWSGGHSFTPFLENILKDLAPVFTAEDRRAALEQADQMPRTAGVMLQLPGGPDLSPAALAAAFAKLGPNAKGPAVEALKEAIVGQLGKATTPEVQAALRHIADADPGQRDAVARTLARFPTEDNWPYLVRGLQSTSPLVVAQVIDALLKAPIKPKAEDPVPFRAAILASGRLPEKQRGKAVELLRHWKAQKFSPEEGNWRKELEGWSRWFGQAFPKEPALPNAASLTAQSKWKFNELLTYLEGEGKAKGDAARGKAVFTKANCIKCHKYGSEGEGIGPDLTTLKNRFKRADVLESILDPSKVISDQYRGSVIVTTRGQTITGLAAPQGDTITVLQIDATKVTIKKSDVEEIVASTVSPMPEKLLDELTQQEIADLFAFLESDPAKR